MKYFIVGLACLLLVGCNGMSKEDYLEIRLLCAKRDGQYFMMVHSTPFGKRVAAGCIENSEVITK